MMMILNNKDEIRVELNSASSGVVLQVTSNMNKQQATVLMNKRQAAVLRDVLSQTIPKIKSSGLKYKCEDRCGWVGEESELLVAYHPFRNGEKIRGCPRCKDVDNLRLACDEPGCRLDATCGFLVGTIYRNTCHNHYKPED